ncbi:MAG: MBL fold metallo-hydrolase [Clostridia bacterium]|nr:MBL fold metallo-hydrolase [Clostridia bacterium]
MRFTVLCENTSARPGIVAEHGFSLLIEGDHLKVLFDMGQTNVFAANAAAMNLSLADVNYAVLSHGHYDHSGGIKTFLEQNPNAPVYVPQLAFGDYYNADDAFIGVDPSLKCHPRIRYTGDFTPLSPGFSLFTCNDLERAFPVSAFGLTECCCNEKMADRFLHEQYLLIHHQGKRILISGCSHKGVENIVSWFQPDIFIGGFHMMKVDVHQEEGQKYLEQLANNLLKHHTVYYTAHCTGTEQYAFLKEKMQDCLQYLSCGDTFALGE